MLRKEVCLYKVWFFSPTEEKTLTLLESPDFGSCRKFVANFLKAHRKINHKSVTKGDEQNEYIVTIGTDDCVIILGVG